MTAPSDGAAEREAAATAAIFAAAGQRAAASQPPRFLAGAAGAMAHHIGLPDNDQDRLIAEMAFWQLHLPGALGAEPNLYYDPAAYFPESYKVVRDMYVEVRDKPLFVMAGFHMAGFPLLSAMIAQADAELMDRRGYVLIARRNAAWLGFPSGQWVREVANVLTTTPADLRLLLAGLRSGEVGRLMILCDGPQPPTARGARALTTYPSLGFGDGLLRRLIDMGAPVRPVSHVWRDNRFDVRWHPYLPTSAEAAVDGYVSLLEELLSNQPEQWLNWPAVATRT